MTADSGPAGRLASISPGQPVRIKFHVLLQEILGQGWSRATWGRAALLRLAAVLLFAAVCSWAGIVLSRQSDGVATIWISNAVVFGLLITQPPRRWLAYFLVGLTADTLADMVYGDPFRVAIGVSVANSVEVIASAVLLTLLFGWPFDLAKRRSLLGFLLVSVVGATALTSALGASWTTLLLPGGPWWQMFRTWYLGDLLGMAILAPPIIMAQRPAFFAILRREHVGHTLLVLAAPALATVLVFTHSGDPLIFLLFPALLLVAFRLGFPGTVLSIVVVSLMAIGFTVKGHGPLMLIAGEHMLLHRIVIAQIFVAVAIFTMFPVAALLEEKDALKDSLGASEARYRDLAHADELTGLANRRAFNLRLARDWEQAQLNRRSLALLLIDADLFKQYNDLHGHLRGDECLRCIAGAIADALGNRRPTAARFGGEEFAVPLPGMDMAQALQVAETIRIAVVQRGLPHPCSPIGVQTVSLGVAALVPMPDQPSTDLVRLADAALYEAKLGGRNQVACAKIGAPQLSPILQG